MHKLIASLAGLGAILLTGCATTPPPPSPIEIAGAQDKRFILTRLYAAAGEGQVLVQGRIVRKRRALRRDYGHIHVEAYSGGVSVAVADAPRLRLGYRISRYADFAAKLPIDAARIDKVVVSHRLTED
jgi:hypothetical protein